MTSYIIKPITQINNIINLMVNMTNDIDNALGCSNNIIQEKIYEKTLSDIFDVVSEYLKYYKFYPNISNICVQIYNQEMNVVIYMKFIISHSSFKIISSNWINFYKNDINADSVVYNNMTMIQQNNLRYSLISGDFFMLDNLNFIYNSVATSGIILKKKNLHYCCNNDPCKKNNIQHITTIYWNVAI